MSELEDLASEITGLIDHHKARLVEDGYDPFKMMSVNGEPYFATLLNARATALLGMTMLMTR